MGAVSRVGGPQMASHRELLSPESLVLGSGNHALVRNTSMRQLLDLPGLADKQQPPAITELTLWLAARNGQETANFTVVPDV